MALCVLIRDMLGPTREEGSPGLSAQRRRGRDDFKKAFEMDPFLKSTFEPLINEAKARPGKACEQPCRDLIHRLG